MAAVTDARDTPVKPRLRGVFHQYACFGSLIAGVALILGAPGQLEKLASAVYAGALSGLFTVSALYHRLSWSPRARRWMRRLDHSMIFVLIAATYTPFAVLVVSGPLAYAMLVVVWTAAGLGVLMKLLWLDAPKWLTALLCAPLGWVGLVLMPSIARESGFVAIALLLAGGVLYTAGALTYALRRPNPWPAVFGYHEIFHVLVVAAAALHFSAVAAYALPAR